MSDQISCSRMAGEFLQDFRGTSQRWRKDRALFSHVARLCYADRSSISDLALPLKHFLCRGVDLSPKCWVYGENVDIHRTPERFASRPLTRDLNPLVVANASLDPSTLPRTKHRWKFLVYSISFSGSSN